jgi:hypothetical protein
LIERNLNFKKLMVLRVFQRQTRANAASSPVLARARRGGGQQKSFINKPLALTSRTCVTCRGTQTEELVAERPEEDTGRRGVERKAIIFEIRIIMSMQLFESVSFE